MPTFATQSSDDHNMKKEPKLTYALDKQGNLVNIMNVERGLACGCVCPKCRQPLEAKKGENNAKHFAHQGGKAGFPNCEGYYITALHMLAEQILEQHKEVMFPAYAGLPSQKKSFIVIEREKRNDRMDLQPDIVGVDDRGVRWMIEIRNTHEVDQDKRKKIKELNANCLEIDIRDQTLEGLEEFLINDDDKREWINVPTYEAELREKWDQWMLDRNISFINGFHFHLPAHPKLKLPPLSEVVLFKSKATYTYYYARIDAEDLDKQKYSFFLCENQADVDNEHFVFPQKNAVICISSDDYLEGEGLIENECKYTWMSFPEEMHKGSVETYVKKIRDEHPDIKGKREDSCLCWYLGNTCQYYFDTISYEGITYHLCLKEEKKKNASKSIESSDYSDLKILDEYYNTLKVNGSLSGYRKGKTVVLHFTKKSGRIVVIHIKENSMSLPYPCIVTRIICHNGQLQFNDLKYCRSEREAEDWIRKYEARI